MAKTKDILKKVRKIEIKTKGLSKNIFAGEYQSAFKGLGMTFSEVREYQFGDDIRNIDWNVTARHNNTYVKVFEEEREMTSVLLIDLSASEKFGTQQQYKRDQIIDIAATLAFSAIQNNDKVGVILFSDKIEVFIPPKKGRKHILRIIKQLIEFSPVSKKTNIDQALKYLNKSIKKRATVFLISDFLDYNYEDTLKVASKRHDLVAIRVFDVLEKELPDIGFVLAKDAETGECVWVDSTSPKNRNQYYKTKKKQHTSLLNTFYKSGINFTEIREDQDYVKSLLTLFKRR